MKLSDRLPDVDVLLALEPDELGLRLLPVLAAAHRPREQFNLANFVAAIARLNTRRNAAGRSRRL